jgi:hypothetical protein
MSAAEGVFPLHARAWLVSLGSDETTQSIEGPV